MRFRSFMLAIALACGCTAEDSKLTPAELDTFEDHWTPTEPEDRGDATLIPPLERDGRAARRMTVDQLRRTIPALFGGITWTGGRNGTVNLFDFLSRTLGEADCVQVTQSNTNPSPLFAKFMDDMAGQVCGRAIQADATAAPAARVLLPYADDVDRNLRFLRLKLHGISGPEGGTDGIAELRRLYDEILADTSRASDAWLGVCVEMLTAPEFMAY